MTGVAVLALAFMAAPSLGTGMTGGSGPGGSYQRGSQTGQMGAAPGEFMFDDLLNKQAVSQQNEALGTVSSLVFDRNGRISYLILSPAPGLKEQGQLVAIPWRAANPSLVEDKVYLSLSRSQLQNAPSLPGGNIAQLENQRMQQRINSYFGAAGAESGVRGYYEDRQQETFRSYDDTRGQYGPENIRVETLFGKPVISRQGQRLGRVEDVLVSRDGRLRFLVISRSDASGQMNQVTAIPWSQAHPFAERDTVTINMSRSQIDDAPHFARSQLSRLQSPQMQQRLFSYYGEQVDRTFPFRANELIGETVTNNEGQQLGVIKDLITNEAGYTKYVVLSPAEQLRMSDKLVAVPLSLLQRGAQLRNGLVMDISQQKLKSAPTFTMENWRDYVSNPQFDQRVHSYFNVQRDLDLSERYPSAEEANMLSANRLIGQMVANRQGQTLGALDDMVTDQSGRVKYLLISPEAGPNRVVAVPWDATSPQIRPNEIMIDVTRQHFANAPSFTRDTWRQLDDPQFERSVNAYFGRGRMNEFEEEWGVEERRLDNF
jgi:sporulation protein YlmC with PRC-barrel domain